MPTLRDPRWKTAAKHVQRQTFERALNGVHAVLDEIADELGSSDGVSNQSKSALSEARDDLQKAALLIEKALKRADP